MPNNQQTFCLTKSIQHHLFLSFIFYHVLSKLSHFKHLNAPNICIVSTLRCIQINQFFTFNTHKKLFTQVRRTLTLLSQNKCTSKFNSAMLHAATQNYFNYFFVCFVHQMVIAMLSCVLFFYIRFIN